MHEVVVLVKPVMVYNRRKRNTMAKIYKRYGLTLEEWDGLDAEARTKLTGQTWVTLPCEQCGKPVTVIANTEPGSKTWCMEHGGTWRDE
jgi:hypothetical protein